MLSLSLLRVKLRRPKVKPPLCCHCSSQTSTLALATHAMPFEWFAKTGASGSASKIFVSAHNACELSCNCGSVRPVPHALDCPPGFGRNSIMLSLLVVQTKFIHLKSNCHRCYGQTSIVANPTIATPRPLFFLVATLAKNLCRHNFCLPEFAVVKHVPLCHCFSEQPLKCCCCSFFCYSSIYKKLTK